ncbi:helix-turn-helix transcriptional regulator [Streptomyces sp. NPDC046727]|uniref:helix-turn-helix domain-containing protein n=1 Tax=Streptomyces sp. NPDC046727 TaxID=3155373 RepID=UPI00340DD777
MRHYCPPRPDDVSDPRSFVDRMRALKAWSGLTYREIAARAHQNGDTLPPSTLAAVLGRATLPREDVVRAFVRVCGGKDETDAWLRARSRIARAAWTPAGPGGAPGPAPDDGEGADGRRERAGAAVTAVFAVACLTSWWCGRRLGSRDTRRLHGQGTH